MMELLEQFSNRQIASLAWLSLAFFGACLIKDVRKSLPGLVKSFFAPKLAGAFIAAILYVTLLVALLRGAGLWSIKQLIATIEWTLTFAFVAMFEVGTAKESDRIFGKILRDLITFTGVFLFIVEMHSFPLGIELLIVPIFTIAAIVMVFAERDPAHRQVHGCLQYFLSIAGTSLFLFSLYMTIVKRADLSPWQALLDFSLPIGFSLAFLPFLYVLNRYGAYDTAMCDLSHWLEDEAMQKRTRRKALLTFGTNIDFLKRWKRYARLKRPQNMTELDATFAEMQKIKAREKNPPVVDAKEGWSPYQAMAFLQKAQVHMGDYHWSYDDEWMASSDLFRIGDGLLPNTISYFVEGNELAATCLKLRVRIDSTVQSDEALDLFRDLALSLMLKAVPELIDHPCLEQMQILAPFDYQLQHRRVRLIRDDFELTGPLEGAYSLTLQIEAEQPAH